MKASADVQLRQFNNTIKRYLEQVKSRTIPEAINDISYEVVGGYGNSRPGALQLTKHANPNEIKRQLSAQIVTTQSKSGKFRFKASLGTHDQLQDTLAARIVNSRLVAKGESAIWGQALKQKAEALIAARVRSVNYVRSQWLAAIRALAPFVKRSFGSGGVKATKPKGGASPAKPGMVTSCTVVWAGDQLDHPAPGISSVAEEGLRKAMSRVEREKDARVQKKFDQVSKQYSDR